MKVRPLIINAESSAAITRCRRYAEDHRLTLDRIKELNNKKVAVGDTDPGYLCEVPGGYRICFSIEQQPVGWCRHISISVDTPGMLPNIHAVDLLLNEFGFRGSIATGGVMKYVEGQTAINVLELADVIESGTTH